MSELTRDSAASFLGQVAVALLFLAFIDLALTFIHAALGD